MKVNKILVWLLITFLVPVFTYAQSFNNDDQKKAEMQNLVQSKKFDFIAQIMLPQAGRSINLTSLYNIKISGDTLISDLPYFGRAYVAPVNPDDGGVHFTSINFKYEVKNRKKGGWDVSIFPADAKDIRQMFLTVTESGSASLQVVSNSRQSIGYNGYIAKVK